MNRNQHRANNIKVSNNKIISLKGTRPFYFFVAIFCFFINKSFAQKDTSRRATIDITSNYKPVLRNAVKINFSATNLNADTSKRALQYSIPSQNLFYTYQPIALKPLALDKDLALDLGNRNFVKLGFGNYTTPYFKAGLSFGDGKKYVVNVYGDYISSQGNIKNQNYSQGNIKSTISYFTPQNEIYGIIAAGQNTNTLYGYDHTKYTFSADTLRQRFQNISLKVGYRNINDTKFDINYDPTIQVSYFTNVNKLAEQSIIVNVPVEKKINNLFAVKLTLNADVTAYTTKSFLPNNIKFNNNIYAIAPEVIYTGSLFTLHVGFTPTFNNNETNLLPNIYGELPIESKKFTIQAGFVGKYNKNTFQNLSAINPLGFK